MSEKTKQKKEIAASLLRFTFATLLITGLAYGALMNSLWRMMPEFHELDTIITIPPYMQIALPFITIILGLSLCKKSSHFRALPLFALALILTITSWYQVSLSSRTKTLTVDLFPFYNKEIKLKTIKTVKIDNRKIIIETTSTPFAIHTGIHPFGLNLSQLNRAFSDYGRCVHKVNNNCIEFGFN
ncbi:hypothetical protein ACFL2V_11800 [Pseudomonadota bacterium]